MPVPSGSTSRTRSPAAAVRCATSPSSASASLPPVAPGLFVNARCDVWFGAPMAAADQLDEAVRRAHAYADAGADGFFVPGLLDVDVLRRLTSEVALPVNV